MEFSDCPRLARKCVSEFVSDVVNFGGHGGVGKKKKSIDLGRISSRGPTGEVDLNEPVGPHVESTKVVHFQKRRVTSNGNKRKKKVVGLRGIRTLDLRFTRPTPYHLAIRPYAQFGYEI